MTTALDKLERIAGRVGWRLRWKSERMKAHPAFTMTELDIFEGKRLVTAYGAVWIMHSSKVDDDNGLAKARESIAKKVLDALPRRGAAAT